MTTSTKNSASKVSLLLTSLVSITLSFFSLADEAEKISTEELIKNSSNYQILDVRSKSEFEEGHIKGAINIPHGEIIDEIERLKAIDKTIVVHCRSGYRAGKAESMMRKNGVTNFKHLEGDMLGWQAKELPLVIGAPVSSAENSAKSKL